MARHVRTVCGRHQVSAGLLAAAAAATGFSAAAWASGGEAHAFQFSIQGFYILDFLVLLGLLVFFVRKPLKSFLGKRRESVKSEMETALALQAEAQAKLDEYTEKLQKLEAEIEQVRHDIREHAEEEKARILADARQEAAKIEQEARNRVVQESHKLRRQLEQRLVEQAIALAEQDFAKKATPVVQQKTIDEYVVRVEKMMPGELNARQ